ncbi:MAG: hypothetical protein ABJH68_10885 [Ilumatobacter sp.]
MISTTKPVDVEVRCDSCTASIDDGATLTWNPLAGAIECAPCASKEVRGHRLVVATVTRSRRPDVPGRSEVVEGPGVDEGIGIADPESTPISDPLAPPALHVFDVQSAASAADAVALVAAASAAGIVGEDDDTAEIELPRLPDDAHSVAGIEVVESPQDVRDGAGPIGFAPPTGLRSMLMPPPFPTVRIARPNAASTVPHTVSATFAPMRGEPTSPQTNDDRPVASPIFEPRLPAVQEPAGRVTLSSAMPGDEVSSSAPPLTTAEAATSAPVTLSNRRIPRSRSKIGHIVVTPTGVFVIEQCPTAGVVTVAKRRGSERVHVDGVDQATTVKRIRTARRAVTGTLGRVGSDGVEVRCVLMVAGRNEAAMTSDAIEILSPEQLDATLDRRGPLDPHAISEIARHLSERFVQS